MGRPALPDPRAVTIGAKITATAAARIDAARGRQSRSAWIAAALDAQLDALQDTAPEPRPATPKPARAPATPPATAKPCAHRGLQAGAYCRTCDSTVRA